MINVEHYQKQMLAMAEGLVRTEASLRADLAREKFDLGKGREADYDRQVVINSLETLLYRVENARRILDQTAVLVCQEGQDVMVVTKVDDRIREIIRLAESRGARVVSVEKEEEVVLL